MLTMPLDTWKDIRATIQAADNEANRAHVIKHGGRSILLRSGKQPEELAVVFNQHVDVADLESFAHSVQRMWKDASMRPTVFVGVDAIEAHERTESNNVLMSSCPDKNGTVPNHLTERRVRMEITPSENWETLTTFLEESLFTTREAIALRGKVAAWLSDEDLARWTRDFKSLTKRVTTEDSTAAIGTIGYEAKVVDRLEITAANGVEVSWFDGFILSAKLYDWSAEKCPVRAMITEDSRDVTKWRCRAIGNALADAVLEGRRKAAEDLRKLMPDTLVVLGNGTTYTTTAP